MRQLLMMNVAQLLRLLEGIYEIMKLLLPLLTLLKKKDDDNDYNGNESEAGSDAEGTAQQ